MKVAILGAKTGSGHESVMKAISAQLKKEKVKVIEFPTFYEDLYESNRILSDFYNMSQARSMELGVLLNEIMVMEGKQQQQRLYKLYLESLDKFFNEKYDIIISVSSLINYHIIRYFKEKRANYIPPIYIVVTDPYNPMYPGFDVKGATKYFCPTDISKEQLIKSGVKKEKIFVFGYPVREEFNLFKTYEIQKTRVYNQITIMINCGASGSFSYSNLILELAMNASKIKFIIICGNNIALKTMLNMKLKSYENVLIFGYVKDIVNFYKISDFCITKPGANSIFECLLSETIPIIYDFDGVMYQEQGIYDFLKESIEYSLRFNSINSLKNFIVNDLDKDELKNIKSKIKSYTQTDASFEIVNVILSDFKNNFYMT